MEAQIENVPQTPAAPAAPAGTVPASTAPAEGTAPAPDDLPALTADEIATLRIAQTRKALRQEKAQHKDVLTAGEKALKAEQLFKEGKHLEALEALGVDPDDFYNKASDQIVNRVKKERDPATIAREAAEAAIKEQAAKAESAKNQTIEQQWTGNVVAALDSQADAFPGVTKALATGRFTMKEIMTIGYALGARGKDSTALATLKAIEAQINPPKTEPPKGSPAVPPPAALTSNAPPSKPEDEENLSFEEALAKAKAKYLRK